MAEPSDASDRSLDHSKGTELEKKELDGNLLDQTVDKVAIETVVSSKIVEEASVQVSASPTETSKQVEETDLKVNEDSTMDSSTDRDSVDGNVRIAADEGEGISRQGSLVDTDQKKQEAGSTEHPRTEDAELADTAARTRIDNDLEGYHEVPILQEYSVETSQDPQGESNIESKANYVGDETGPQADIITKEPVLEEMEVHDVRMVDYGQDSSHEAASVMQTTSAETNRNIQEESVAFDVTLGQQAADVSADAESADTVVAAHIQIFGSELTLDPQHDASQEASPVLGSILVDADVGGQADHVAKEPSPADATVEIQHQEISDDRNESTMDGSQGRDDRASLRNIKEENVVLDKVSIDDTIGQGDHNIVPEVVADIVLEAQPQSTERERERGCGSLMDGDHNGFEEDSIPKAHSVVTSKSNGEDDGSFVPVPVGVVIGSETDFVLEDAKLDDPSLRSLDKVRGVETDGIDGLITNVDEVDDEGRCAHQVSSLQKISSVKTVKDLQKGDDELTGPRADVMAKDPVIADQEVGVQAQETGREMEVNNVGIVDVDVDNAHAASASQVSLMNTKCNIQGLSSSVLGPDAFDDANCITTGPNQDELVVVQTQVTCEEAKSGNESMMNPHKDTSQPASVPQMTLVYTRRNILQKASRLVFAIDSLDGQSDHVAKAKIKQTETDGGDGFTMEGGDNRDHEASILQTSLTATSENQNVQEESVTEFDSTPLGENAHILEPSLGIQIIVSDSEVIKKDMSPSSACKKVEPIRESEGKWEIQARRNTENVLVDESTDDKQNLQVEEGELLQGTDKQVVHCSAMGISVSPMENKKHISYHLPSIESTIFSISDLVWGKVKSHPWWPGQIFDPSNASQLALKYQKKDRFLVAYFGDKTFAWCDESQLKPFFSYFSQMEKQCSSDIFVTAVNDIMVEISRRIELGMICSCVPEETYADIKFQTVDNAGVQRGNVTPILDRSQVLNYFQPRELIEYIKKVAQFPNGGIDKLELVMAKSQLKAFYSSKGYPELPKFTVDRGLVEDVIEIPLPNVEGPGEDTAKPSAPPIADLSSGEGKLRSRENSCKKRKHVLEGRRKRTKVTDLSDEENALHLRNGGSNNSGSKGPERSISSSSGRKHAVLVSDSSDSGRHKKKMLDFFENIERISPSPTVANSFKIGELIRRAASQLTGAPPIVKYQQETFPVNFPQDDHNRGDVTDFDVLPPSPEENKGTITSVPEDSSPDEMSQLCLAARDGESSVPMRNSCTLEGNKHDDKRKRDRLKKMISQSLFSELFSDISSSEEKPVEERKRARPKRYSQAAISDISSSEEQHDEKCSSEDQHVEKRKRGRPKNVISQPTISDISTSEEKNVEKPRGGRLRKLSSQLVSSDTSTPDYKTDSNCSDAKLQKRRRKKIFFDDYKEKGESHMQIRQKRKSTGEVSPSLPSGSVWENERLLQLVNKRPNKKYSSIAERPVIRVKEKTAEEHMPTALILRFSSSDTLPSPSDLIRIFSRYGPLKEAETDVFRKTNRARVVFKRRADAETAFSSAGKYSIFGPGLLSYQLKYLPCSPNPAPQITQVQHDAASGTKPHESNDNAPVVLPQDNLNPAIATSPEYHDPTFLFTPNTHETHVTTANDDTTPVSRPQDDSGSISTPVKEHDVGPMQGCNLDVSEAADDAILVEANAKISPWSNYGATSITQPEEFHDKASSDTAQDKHDSTPITTSGDYHDNAPFTTS